MQPDGVKDHPDSGYNGTMNNATTKEVEDVTLRRSEDLCRLAEMLGYGRGPIKQLTCSNGAHVSSLLQFFDDNPGAMEAVHEFVLVNLDAYDLDEEEEDEDEEETDEACPGKRGDTPRHGCVPGDGVTEGCEDPGGCGELRPAATARGPSATS